MPGFLIRLLIAAAGLALAAYLVPGIELQGTVTLVGAALLLGFVNAVVRPLLVLLTLPLTVVTLGLFLLFNWLQRDSPVLDIAWQTMLALILASGLHYMWRTVRALRDEPPEPPPTGG